MRTRSSVLAALLVSVLAGGALAGCGGSGGGGNAQPSGGTVSSSASDSAPAPGSSPSSFPPSDLRPPSASASKYPPGELTLTGTPEEGVEAGCIVMRSNGVVYQLVGGDRQMLLSGRPVVVRGTPNPGLISICQQGTPLQVSEVRAA
jgi:hypothetical protein